LAALKDGVNFGKQFPFRYYSALKAVNNSSVNYKSLISDALEECIDLAMMNFPKLKGKTICLSDNSGSAWGAFNSEYGKVTVADIGNLSSVMTAINSDEGYIGLFGDTLKIKPISKRSGVLLQHLMVSKEGKKVGQATEHGIWLFFRNAIDKCEYYDNIFIYSDMQAGHGGLYGTSGVNKKDIYKKSATYIDVLKMIKEYRSKVNSKVNIFSIQTAGYNNSVMPESLYRGALLAGWTGKEVVYAKRIIDIWNEIENRDQ
jgi:60 kDa SS-A/Ro ribonucleoprotein